MSLLPWRWKKRQKTAPEPVIQAPAVDPGIARQERIARRLANDEAARDPSMLLTTDAYPVYYLPITKCGCTFLKNLFYSLDHGTEHPAGLFVHEEDDGLLNAAAQDYETVFNSPYSFTVLRDPASRFMSLYFDKIWGDGAVNFPKIRTHLAEIGVIDLSRDLDTEQHRENAYRLLDWVSRNLQGETDLAINYHWRPQTSRLRRARMFRLNYLTLEGLDWQLPMLMAPVVPDMAERMQVVKSRNKSARPAPAADVLDEPLTAAIRKLYRADTILHDRAHRAWAGQAQEQRQGEFASPPLPRHQRVQRIHAPQTTSLTYAAQAGGVAVADVLTASGLMGQVTDIQLEGLSERNERALVLMRDPLERFGALYNLMNTRPRRSGFTALRLTLTKRRGFIPQPQTLDDHVHNLPIMVTYMRRRGDEFTHAHGLARSRMQSHDIRRVVAAGGTPVFFDRLAEDLPALLDRPDLATPLSAIVTANRLPDDIAAALTGPVAESVRSLYRTDFDLYDSLRSAAGLPVSGEWA